MRSILLVSPSAAPGGAERALVGLARLLPSYGFSPTSILLERGPLADWLAEASCPFQVIDAPRLRRLRKASRTIGGIARVASELGAEAIVSSQTRGHVYGGRAARRAGLPEIWWEHDIIERGLMARAAARTPSAAVVCISDAAVAALRRLTRKHRIVKIPTGAAVVKAALYRSAGTSVRRSLGWQHNRIVGIVGRLEPRKGQHVFLRAAGLVAPRRPDVRFAVVGGAVLGHEGTYPGRLRRIAADLGIAGVVHFAGHQADPYPWLDALDVFVSASLREPFGLAIVEAMALAKPVVAPDAGGPRDIVESGASGLLVPPEDPRALAEAIGRLLDDRELARRLGEAAERRAWGFSEERMTERFAGLLRETLAGARAKERS